MVMRVMRAAHSPVSRRARRRRLSHAHAFPGRAHARRKVASIGY